jgi:VanZ family protein
VDHLPSGRIRIRRKRVTLAARSAWLLLCAFIVYGSMGTWELYQPGIWAPTLVSVRDVIVNVALYVVFGALGVLAMRDTYRRHWLRLVVRLTGLAILFSASNEALQLYTIDRVASLTDVVSAAIGAFAGSVVLAAGRVPRYTSAYSSTMRAIEK